MALINNIHVPHVIKPFFVPQTSFQPCHKETIPIFCYGQFFLSLVFLLADTMYIFYVAIISISFRLTCIPRLKVTLIFHSGSGDVIDGKEKDLGFMVMNALAVLLSGTGSANAGNY